MTHYKLKNFLGLLLGIKKEYIVIENGANIDFHIVEEDKIILGYSDSSSNKKPTNKLIEELAKLIKADEDLGEYEVMLGDMATEQFFKIEMIDTVDDCIVLGIENNYMVDNSPRDSWYYSDSLNALTFENDNFHLIINQETYEDNNLGFSVFVRSKSGNVRDNKFTYFANNESLINRFDFKSFGSFSPDSSLLDFVSYKKLHSLEA